MPAPVQALIPFALTWHPEPRRTVRMQPSVVTLAIAAALALSGCDRLGLGASASVRLSPDTAVLAIHGRLHLGMALHDVAAPDVYFVSSDTAVVVVYPFGVGQAVGYGRAVVTGYDMRDWALRDSTVVLVPAPPGPWIVLLPDTTSVSTGAVTRLAWRVGSTGDRRVRFGTSDSTIAEVSDSGLVCGRAVGQAFIRAVSASDVAADSTRVRVLAAAPPTPGVVTGVSATMSPPTISIASIVDTAGKPVDPEAVRGTIRVSVAIDLRPCFPRAVVALMIDGHLWQDGPDVFRSELRYYMFTVDTRAADAAGQPRMPNGTHMLTVLLRTPGGTTLVTTSQAIIVAN